MNLENQGSGPDSSSSILFKRKRGRPRKDQSQNPGRIANVLTLRDQIQGRREYAPVPHIFAGANGNHARQENAADHNDDRMVGQTVTGVIEAAFDAGYLLSLRVGNSETSLRGVVFKPGHYVPVSAENDVAPHIQVIRRNVVPFSARHHTPVRGSYRRGRGRGRARSESCLAYSTNGSSKGNQLAKYSDKQLQIVPYQPVTPVGDQGTVVPVVLQPGDLSNGVAPATETLPAHLAASKARLVNQMQITQMEKDVIIDNGPPLTEAHHIERFTVELPGGATEELVSEVVKRTQASSESKETQNESAQSSSAVAPEQMQDLSKPLLDKPLQALQPLQQDSIDQSPSVPQNFRDPKAGKMTELLLAVQENLIDKQAADMQHHDFRQEQN